MTPDEYLPIFFGPGNDLRYNDLVGGRWGEHAAALEPWIERLKSGMPSLLPRRRGEDLYWYGLASSAAEAEELRAHVLAWVGPSYSDFAGRPPVNAGDPFDASVAEQTGDNWFVLQVAPDARDHVRNALGRMRRLIDARPERVDNLRYPIGRLLRDFDWALQQRDPARSRDLLEAIRSSGHLSAMNVSYLKVRRLSELGLNDDLLDLPELPDVIATRRPKAVTSAVLEAVHSRHIEELASVGDVDGTMRAFEDHVAGRYNQLFSGLGPWPGLGELRLYLLWAVLEPQKPELRDEVMAAASEQSRKDELLAALAIRIDDRMPGATPWATIALAIAQGAYKRALEQLQSISDGALHARLAIQAANGTREPDAARYAIQLFNALPPADRSELENDSRIAELVSELGAIGSMPASWLGLLSAIDADSMSQSQVAEAQDHWNGWSIDDLLNSVPAAEHLLLSDRSPQVDALLRSVLPGLVANLLGHPNAIEDTRVRTLLTAILYVLRLADGRSQGDLEVLLDLADQLLSVASTQEYEQLTSDLHEVWNEDQSIRRLRWLLDLAELIAAHPRRDKGSIARISASVQEAVRRWHAEMAVEERTVAFSLLTEFGVPTEGLVPGAEDLSIEELPEIPKVQIGIYTLTPGVGDRVARILSERAPQVNVRVNSDTHASDRLAALARESDVLVVVTRSATHAATNAIKKARDQRKPILYARGKGSTSVLAEITAYFVGSPSSA